MSDLPRTLAIGSDHGGLVLKNAVAVHLKAAVSWRTSGSPRSPRRCTSGWLRSRAKSGRFPRRPPRLTRGPVSTTRLTGHHYEIMTPPAVNTLARQLAATLRRVGAEQAAPA
jgi:hypothetical protein